jgi:hypothetical protein
MGRQDALRRIPMHSILLGLAQVTCDDWALAKQIHEPTIPCIPPHSTRSGTCRHCAGAKDATESCRQCQQSNVTCTAKEIPLITLAQTRFRRQKCNVLQCPVQSVDNMVNNAKAQKTAGLRAISSNPGALVHHADCMSLVVMIHTRVTPACEHSNSPSVECSYLCLHMYTCNWVDSQQC